MNPNKDVELEEIKIKGNDPNTQNPQSIRVIDETNSYDSLNTSVMPNSSRKYEPTMTSVIGRKKKKQEGFDGDNSENDDSDDENDKKARLKRNMTQMLDYDQKKKEERYEKIGLGDSQEYDDFDWFADDYNNDRDKEDEKSDDEEKNENLKSKISKIPKAVRYWAWLILGDLIFSVS